MDLSSGASEGVGGRTVDLSSCPTWAVCSVEVLPRTVAAPSLEGKTTPRPRMPGLKRANDAPERTSKKLHMLSDKVTVIHLEPQDTCAQACPASAHPSVGEAVLSSPTSAEGNLRLSESAAAEAPVSPAHTQPASSPLLQPGGPDDVTAVTAGVVEASLAATAAALARVQKFCIPAARASPSASPFQVPQRQKHHLHHQLLQQKQQQQSALLHSPGSGPGLKAWAHQQMPNLQRQGSSSSAFGSPPASPLWEALRSGPGAPPPPRYPHASTHGHNCSSSLPTTGSHGCMGPPSGSSNGLVLHSLPLVTAALAAPLQPTCPVFSYSSPVPHFTGTSLGAAAAGQQQLAMGQGVAALLGPRALKQQQGAVMHGTGQVGGASSAHHGSVPGLGHTGGGLHLEVGGWDGGHLALGVPPSPVYTPGVGMGIPVHPVPTSPGGCVWATPVHCSPCHPSLAGGLLLPEQAGAAVGHHLVAEQQSSSSTVNAVPPAAAAAAAEEPVPAADAAAAEGQGESGGPAGGGQAMGDAVNAEVTSKQQDQSVKQEGDHEEQTQGPLEGPAGDSSPSGPNHSQKSDASQSMRQGGACPPDGGAAPAAAVDVPDGGEDSNSKALGQYEVGGTSSGGALPQGEALGGRVGSACRSARHSQGADAVYKVAAAKAAAAAAPGEGGTTMEGLRQPDVAVAAATAPGVAVPTQGGAPRGDALVAGVAVLLGQFDESLAAIRLRQAKAVAQVKQQWAAKAAALQLELARAEEEVAQLLAAVQKEADLQLADLKHEIEVGLLQLRAR